MSNFGKLYFTPVKSSSAFSKLGLFFRIYLPLSITWCLVHKEMIEFLSFEVWEISPTMYATKYVAIDIVFWNLTHSRPGAGGLYVKHYVLYYNILIFPFYSFFFFFTFHNPMLPTEGVHYFILMNGLITHYFDGSIDVGSLGILLTANWLGNLAMCMVNRALNPGSSKHGKAFLASVASNCVAASHLYHLT